jgi:hypothetical protein
MYLSNSIPKLSHQRLTDQCLIDVITAPFSVFTITMLGPKEAEMQIIGCDLYARQQTLAILDTGTGEVRTRTVAHEGSEVQEFYATLAGPVRVGIEATGSMARFLSLLEELGIDCQVGHPAKIRAAEPRK